MVIQEKEKSTGEENLRIRGTRVLAALGARHRIHKVKDGAGIVPRRLHCLLDALRYFGGGELSLSEHRPIE